MAWRAGAAELTAAAQFQGLQATLRDDTKRADWTAALADAKAIKAFVHDGPTARLEVARAYQRLGDGAAALAEIKGFLALGETHPLLDGDAFGALKPAYRADLERNRAPIGKARVAFRLNDSGAVPEDIDYDPQSRRVFVSEVLGKAVVAIDPRGRSRAFVRGPDGWPMMALKVDARRRRLWVTEVALSGFEAAPKADWGRSAILSYDLASGRLLRRVEGPTGSSLGDMTLAANGDPIVSDGEGGGVYRLAGGRFIRLDHGEFLSPQTAAFCGDPNLAFVPDYVRGLARLDLRTGAVAWLSGRDQALDGVDGLYCRGRTLFAVQNGASPMRVVAFRLDPSKTMVIGEQVIDRARQALGDPTHGVLVGPAFYYLANVGWPLLDEHGLFAAGPLRTPPTILRADLRPRPSEAPGGHARPRAARPSAN